MKQLLFGLAFAVIVGGGLTAIVLHATPQPTPVAEVQTATEATAGDCPPCPVGSSVCDVADLQAVYSAPVTSNTVSFEEPPLAPKREVLPPPREVK